MHVTTPHNKPGVPQPVDSGSPSKPFGPQEKKFLRLYHEYVDRGGKNRELEKVRLWPTFK